MVKEQVFTGDVRECQRHPEECRAEGESSRLNVAMREAGAELRENEGEWRVGETGDRERKTRTAPAKGAYQK